MGFELPTDTQYREGAAQKLDIEELNDWRRELINMPMWRTRAQVEEDYYDGNQMDAQTLRDMEDRGIPPITLNLIGPTIDAAKGLEAKTRTDYVVRPDGDDWDDAALWLSEQVHKHERMTKADDACADAYECQLVSGLGWVEVARSSNRLDGKYRIRYVDWREMWWDFHSERTDLGDAKFVMRRKWFDRRYLMVHFPKMRSAIENAPRIMRLSSAYDSREFTEPALMYGDDRYGRDYTLTELDWINTHRDRVCLDEIWYRRYVRAKIIEFNDDRVVEFDPNNPVHVIAIQRGMARIYDHVVPRIRVSFWLGPVCLMDRETPYEHGHFPYVPFWGYREKRTRVPYGLVRRMVSPQDELNARRSKMLWGMSARRVIVDDDAVKDHDATREEVARLDAYIIRNSGRAGGSDINIDDNYNLNAQQFSVYQDSKEMLQQTGGIYQAMLGDNQAGVTSGIAINSLIEQGQTTLGAINDNYRTGRTLVGELLLSLIIQDNKGRVIQDSVKDASGRQRPVALNVPRQIGDMQVRDGDLSLARVNLKLDDLPSTPTFRMQQFMRLTEMVSSLPPNLQGAVIDMVFESSDLPNKGEIVARLRKMMGVGQDPAKMSPEEQQELLGQKQAAEQEKSVQMAEREAEIRKKLASAGKDEAHAQKIMREIDEILVGMSETQQDMAHQQAHFESGAADESVSYHW